MTSADLRWLDGENSEKSGISDAEQETKQRIATTNTTSIGILEIEANPESEKMKKRARSTSMPASPRPSKKKQEISHVKSKRSKNTAPHTTESSQTLRRGSISSGAGLLHFWSRSKQEMSQKLSLPIGIDSLALESSYLNVRSKNMMSHSTWFQTKIQKTQETQNKSFLKICSPFVTTSWPRTMDGAPRPFIELERKNVKSKEKKQGPLIRSIKLKLSIQRQSDRDRLNRYFGIVRWTYNQAVAHLRDKKTKEDREKTIDPASGRPISLLKFLRRKIVNDESELVQKNAWLKTVGYDIRDAALNDALTAYTTGLTKLKSNAISHFNLNFRSRKKTSSESLFLRSKWITCEASGNRVVVKWPNQKQAMPFFLPNSANQRVAVEKDCRLQRTTLNAYYLCVPIEYKKPAVSMIETQDPQPALRICSIDPGVRTFQTIYDVSGSRVIHVAPQDFKKICRLTISLDKLISRKARQPTSKKKYRIGRAMRRAQKRIRNLIDEVHKQLAKFLATEFDLILLPVFNTSKMIRKRDRKIQAKSVRAMTTWAHYRFRQRLIFKAQQYGAKVALVDESFTSKTCSSCGALNHTLGSAKTFLCPICGLHIDRDVNGAKNIFLKNFEALEISVSNSGAYPLDS